MRRIWNRERLTQWTMMLSGGLFILGGCDPTLQTTVENGIITASNSFLASLLQAAIQVIQEGAAAGTTP